MMRINYKNKEYPSTSKIKILSDLIINNINLLKVISRLYLYLDKDKQENKKVDRILMEGYMIKSIKRSVISGHVLQDVANDFNKRWMKMTDQEIGYVLEEVIAHKGPYLDTIIQFDLSRDAKVHDTGLSNDFDVVFFDKLYSDKSKYGQDIDIGNVIEFHECKKNVCTFIPASKNTKLNKSVRNKLNFMKKTHELASDSDSKFYIPTFYSEVDSQRKYLKNTGYNFIEILSINDLITKFCM